MHFEPSSPPAKANLKAWWNNLKSTQKQKKGSEREKSVGPGPSVFGKPLRESLKYASVQISTVDANGERYVWGYIPVVVAKCGLYLKEHATEVPGTFRVNGSSKRMRDLQAKFDFPPRYGKSLDWKKETYNTHDVASVFRRYLTQMPEPVIPHDMYHLFRDALTRCSRTRQDIIATYQRLIRELPRPNRFLLLYVLDLLSVFARKYEKNLMTSGNLAVIFQPGLISHPNHERSPGELSVSQQVLEFLIEEQDAFIVDAPSHSRHHNPPRTFSEIEEPSGSGEDSEFSGVGGSWNLVERERWPSTSRGKNGKTNGENANASADVVFLPPGTKRPTGVKRSRTLPSSRKQGHEEEQRARVLRKHKRASTRPSSED